MRIIFLYLFSVHVFAQSSNDCSNLSGNYQYLNGNGVATVIHKDQSVTMVLIWIDGDEYLIRTTQSDKNLIGNWALLKENGQNVTPIFRNYNGIINSDCSITGVNSDDPDGSNIDQHLLVENSNSCGTFNQTVSVVSENLNIKIPSATFENSNIWIDLEYKGISGLDHIWRLKDYGKNE